MRKLARYFSSLPELSYHLLKLSLLDSDAVPAANAQAMMQIQPAGLHKDVILISLLKGWCEANGKSTSKSQRLYKKMFRKFQEHQVRLSGKHF